MDLLRNGIKVEERLAAPFIDAAGTDTLTPEVMSAVNAFVPVLPVNPELEAADLPDGNGAGLIPAEFLLRQRVISIRSWSSTEGRGLESVPIPC